MELLKAQLASEDADSTTVREAIEIWRRGNLTTIVGKDTDFFMLMTAPANPKESCCLNPSKHSTSENFFIKWILSTFSPVLPRIHRLQPRPSTTKKSRRLNGWLCVIILLLETSQIYPTIPLAPKWRFQRLVRQQLKYYPKNDSIPLNRLRFRRWEEGKSRLEIATI